MSVVTTLGVSGMTCDHCVAAVTRELSELSGVGDVRVDLRSGAVSRVTVTSEGELDEAAVAEAVDEAGYRLTEA